MVWQWGGHTVGLLLLFVHQSWSKEERWMFHMLQRRPEWEWEGETLVGAVGLEGFASVGE